MSCVSTLGENSENDIARSQSSPTKKWIIPCSPFTEADAVEPGAVGNGQLRGCGRRTAAWPASSGSSMGSGAWSVGPGAGPADGWSL